MGGGVGAVGAFAWTRPDREVEIEKKGERVAEGKGGRREGEERSRNVAD